MLPALFFGFIGFHLASGSGIIFANPNQRITLQCNINQKADKMRWYFRSGPQQEEVYVYDTRLQPYDGYVGICHPESLQCHLDILNVTAERAGMYRFDHGSNGKKRIQACEYQLIVGELECYSNIRINGIMIGENDCNVQPDVLKRSCAFKYHGNHHHELHVPPKFVWMRNMTPGKIFMDRIMNGTLLKEEYKWNVEDAMEISSGMHNSQHECTLEGYKFVHSCQLPKFFVQYARNTSELSQTVEMGHFHGKECFINESKSLDCSYHWILQENNLNVKVEQQNLTEENLKQSGLYRCIATCYFVSGEICIIGGSQLKASVRVCPSNHDSTLRKVLGVIIAIVALAFFGLLIFTLSRRTNRKKSIDRRLNGQKGSQNAINI